MKIMDEKGRLFGRINVLDLGVLVIVILLAAWVGYKYIPRATILDDANMQNMVISVKCAAMPETAATAIKADALLEEGSKFVSGKILTVKYTDSVRLTTSSDGQRIQTTDAQYKDIYVTIKTRCDPSLPVIKIGTQELRVGRPFTIKTQSAFAKGVITDIQAQP